MKKICFIASSGGHFEQLMMLQPLMEENDSFIITEKTDYQIMRKDMKFYYLKQVNRRELTFIFKMFLNFFKSVRIFYLEQPDIVISTGALSTIPMLLLAKLFNKKLIFIESFAKVNSPTLTGRLLYYFTDQFYVQWEEMLEIYPNAIFKGGIY